jgi:glycosyltransferase involved in cell wall biosynthesis
MRIALVSAFPLHVIPGFEMHQPPGHYATWLPQLCEAFGQQSEFELHWLITSRTVDHPEPIRWRNQTFHCLHAPGRFRTLRGYPADCRVIRRRLKEIQPDLVHAWGTEDCCGLAVAGAGQPWLLSMQGILQEYVRTTRMHPFVRLQALYEPSVLRCAQEITVESRWGRSVLQRLAPHARYHLVEYGVPEIFYGYPWTPNPEKPTAIFVGTLDERKGIQDAVQAFADPRLASAELQIIGDREGKLARALEQRATKNVRWLGRLSRAETARALSRAWCLVLPTRADTSPNVVKEARVIGLPVVTTPHGGQSDYIIPGENGFLVEPGDITGLSSALVSVLGDLSVARAMGAQRWPEQREFFRSQHTARKFLDVYRKLTGKSA